MSVVPGPRLIPFNGIDKMNTSWPKEWKKVEKEKKRKHSTPKQAAHAVGEKPSEEDLKDVYLGLS